MEALPRLPRNHARYVPEANEVIGLTGGIASGKSTASRLLRTHKIPVVDLDEIAVEVVKPGTPTLRRLVETFGTDILNEDKSLNRGELGRRAFGDKEKTKLLNKITHGAIRRVMLFRLIKLWLTGARCAVVDTPLLIEAGLYKWCALTVLVWWYVCHGANAVRKNSNWSACSSATAPPRA